MKKLMSLFLIFAMLCGLSFHDCTSRAASVRLNAAKKTIYLGSSYKLKVKGTTAKIKWSSSKPDIATVSKNGRVSARTSGYATITAKVGKKKLRCKITVKTKKIGKGTKANPISAYNTTSFNFYEEGKKKGKFSLKLLRFEAGESANTMAAQNSANPVPEGNQEYIYFKLQLTYLSGNQTIDAKDIFNYYYNIFGDNSTRQMINLDWGFFFEPVDDLGTLVLSPGNKVTCGKAILVEKGHTPITFRIQTGKNSFTWFTTEV